MLVQLNNFKLGPLNGVYADIPSIEKNAIDDAISFINSLLCRCEVKYPGNSPKHFTHAVRVDDDKWILERQRT